MGGFPSTNWQEQTSATTTAGVTPFPDSALSVPTTAITAGSYYASRAITTLSGTITGGAFVAGLRAGLTVTGTMNHEDSRLAGAYVKLATNGATLTAGQISVLWVDVAAAVSGDGGGQFNMIRVSNTQSGSKPNSVIYMYSNASFLFDLGAPSGTIDYVASAGTSAGSAGKSDGCAATKVIKLNLNGSTVYVPVFEQNT